MFGSKISVLFLPLLFLVGAHSFNDDFHTPQEGEPWVAPIIIMNSTGVKQKRSDPGYYMYQAPAAISRHSENRVRRDLCPQSNGYFRYPARCDSFVKCQNYQPIRYTCPGGLHFNPSMQWTESPCDHPSRVQCNEKPVESHVRLPPIVPQTTVPTTPSTTTTTTTKKPTTTTTPEPWTPAPKVVPPPRPRQPAGFRCPQPHGYFRHTDHCGDYVECKNYIPLQFSCPSGLHFNPRVQWTDYPCDYPSKVKCDAPPKYEKPKTTTSTTTTTTTTTPAPTTPEPTTPATYKPKFVTPRPVKKPSGFRCPQQHGYYMQPNRCGGYIECKNYVSLSYMCPAGLHFNPQAQWTQYPCDHPSRVECNREPVIPEVRYIPPSSSTTTSTTTTTTTTTTPPPPPIIEEPVYEEPEIDEPEIEPRYEIQQPNNFCPQPYGYFKYFGQCGEYVECKNYVPLRFACPAGLHFNPQVQWTDYPCEHPSKVQCNKEPITEKPTTTSTTSTTTTTTPAPTTTVTYRPKLVPTPRPARPAKPVQNFKCPQPHGYYEYYQCEEYVECKNYVPMLYTCPAGLHFNRNVQWTEYPCHHPSRAQCMLGKKK